MPERKFLRGALGLAVILAVVALFSWWYGSRRDQVQKSGAPAGAEPSDVVAESTERIAEPVSTASAARPIASGFDAPPVVDGPLQQTYRELAARADQGDPVASCRLALELDACRSKSNFDANTLDALAGPVSTMQLERQEVMIEVLAASQERGAIAAAHCAGLEALPEDDAELRARTAAERGSTRLRVLYALRVPRVGLVRLFPPVGLSVNVEAEEIVPQFYADHAMQYLEEGFAFHDLLALEGLILAHAPRPLQRTASIPFSMPNPQRFVVLATLYERLIQRLPSDVKELRNEALASLSAEEQIRAQQTADSEFDRWRSEPLPRGSGRDSSPADLCSDSMER